MEEENKQTETTAKEQFSWLKRILKKLSSVQIWGVIMGGITSIATIAIACEGNKINKQLIEMQKTQVQPVFRIVFPSLTKKDGEELDRIATLRSMGKEIPTVFFPRAGRALEVVIYNEGPFVKEVDCEVERFYFIKDYEDRYNEREYYIQTAYKEEYIKDFFGLSSEKLIVKTLL